MGAEFGCENYCISPKQATRRCYRTALQDEIHAGRMAHEENLNNLRINHPYILSYKKKILQQDSPPIEYADWAHFLLKDYGPRERCLSLGSGIGRIEKYLVNCGFTERMETYELCAEINESIRLTDPKIQTLAADLNFTNLPEDSYDFILCHGILHHLINLEHILHKINLALKKDGILVVYEYVGETRWQFSEDRLKYLKMLFPHLVFRRPRIYEVKGFESIRSGELLGLIQSQFGNTCQLDCSYGGIYFPFVVCAVNYDETDLKNAIAHDEMVFKEKKLPPCYHIGIYGKSDRSQTPARQWTDDELDSKLTPPAPLSFKFRRAIRQSPIGPLGIWVNENLIKKLL